jgi:hypothetical protein
MRDVQPPIASDEEFHGYQTTRDTMTALVAEREARLIVARSSGDGELIEDRHFELLNALRKREGIIDAITAYEQRRQSA